MSIAVSVPLAPSRLLQCLCLAFAAVCVAMGVAAAAGALGPLRWPLAAGAIRIGAGLAVVRAGWLGDGGRATVRRFDVLGPGRLVLTVQQGVAATDVRGPHGAQGPPDLSTRVPVRLMAGSTLWPGLLVLRLRGEQGELPALVLFADSVPGGEFRRLAMALRAVAARATAAVEK